MGLVIGWGSSPKSAKMAFINDTSKYRYPVVINQIKLKTWKVSPHWTSFETFITLALGGTTKCRNNSLVPPPHTEYEPLNNAASTHLPQSDGDPAWCRRVTLVRTALPSWSHNCPMGFRPELHAGQAKRSPGQLQTRTLPSTFSYVLPVFAQWHGLYSQVTNVACHCMDHGNNDHCDQC